MMLELEGSVGIAAGRWSWLTMRGMLLPYPEPGMAASRVLDLQVR
jgi:hypothetical protein